MAATIRDVARVAGVTPSTVSYALSGKRAISEETRERIQRAIVELDFTPNAGARALALSQTNVLGLFLQFQEDEFAPAMLQYVLPVSTTARNHGFDLLMVTDPDVDAAIRRTTSSAMVDGVVLLDVTYDDPRLEPLRQTRQPAALIGYAKNAEGFDAVDLDFGEAARNALDHLHGLGHREVVLVTPPRHVSERGGSYAWRFSDAAAERAARHGMQLHIVEGESRQPALGQAVTAALDRYPSATALVVHNDATIAALPSLLHERGISVPDDLSVVGMFSAEFGTAFSLPYTSVDTRPELLGEWAVSRLVERIADPEGAEPPQVRLIEPGFVDRGSTRAV
ncbi:MULTISPECIES: LacI family DNA-binding transcriptional regulator [unclassified Leifsonia]|uniref:LacI family DNA-binding transcriptional regulator n=1 Tax=unclassified Leifsonia TaxID=2663824 RepID=UPI00035F3E4F|nr:MULTISPECIES: LacI family DNA-binding transcriptional regulator [unclassified Leifsonia]TDQ02417.1 LacI family transcriptional regulator [Leifsonia sp. 115AMFTsu3.1]